MSPNGTADEYIVQELASIADALKRLGALVQQPVQPQSSVEIARNSKGVTWVVKAYHANPVEASTLAQELYDQLADRYGQPADDVA
jgi:hypothetical protein